MRLQSGIIFMRATWILAQKIIQMRRENASKTIKQKYLVNLSFTTLINSSKKIRNSAICKESENVIATASIMAQPFQLNI